MIDLWSRDITWDAAAGQPVVLYADVGDALRLPIGVSAEDARLLAAVDNTDPCVRGRLFRLIGATLVALGARLIEVVLEFHHEDVLAARLRFTGLQADVTLAASAIDGLILARWAALPVRMADDDARRVRSFVGQSVGHDGGWPHSPTTIRLRAPDGLISRDDIQTPPTHQEDER